MITVSSPLHRLHDPEWELLDGRPSPPLERPERAERILDAVVAAGVGEVREPDPDDPAVLRAVHTGAYLRFLATVHGRWAADVGEEGGRDARAWVRSTPGLAPPPQAELVNVHAALAVHAHDADPVTAGTWQAACAAADVAATAARLVAGGERAAYGLCRPPGHHATASSYGGYCYLNNAAVAVEVLRRKDAARVAVLDVDYHHGNGTQSIFWDRPEVLVVSLHADPAYDYPYLSGFADEVGGGPGEGTTRNLPLPDGADWAVYGPALDDALAAVRSFAPDVLVVSLGVDTALEDPDRFRLVGDDFVRMGAAIAGVGRPTVFVQEGGYALEVIGRNVVGVLGAFEGG